MRLYSKDFPFICSLINKTIWLGYQEYNVWTLYLLILDWWWLHCSFECPCVSIPHPVVRYKREVSPLLLAEWLHHSSELQPVCESLDNCYSRLSMLHVDWHMVVHSQWPLMVQAGLDRLLCCCSNASVRLFSVSSGWCWRTKRPSILSDQALTNLMFLLTWSGDSNVLDNVSMWWFMMTMVHLLHRAWRRDFSTHNNRLHSIIPATSNGGLTQCMSWRSLIVPFLLSQFSMSA